MATNINKGEEKRWHSSVLHVFKVSNPSLIQIISNFVVATKCGCYECRHYTCMLVKNFDAEVELMLLLYRILFEWETVLLSLIVSYRVRFAPS